jgi:hypothetical protein
VVFACFFGREREQVVLVKDSRLQKYYLAARSHGKKHLASTPSSLLSFSHSFDVEYLHEAAVGTAVAIDGIASVDQMQGLKGRSLLCLVPSLRGPRLQNWLRYLFICLRYFMLTTAADN